MSSETEFSFGIRTRRFSESGSEYPDPQRTDLYIHDVVDNFYRGIFSGSRWVWDDSAVMKAEFEELMNERMKLAMKALDDLPGPVGPVVYEDYDEDIEEEIQRIKTEEEQDEPLAQWEIDLLEAEKFYNEQAAKEGPDALEVNAKGGKQSKLDVRFDLVPPNALHEVAETLALGAEKYGIRNWRKINPGSHVNHALAHLNTYLRAAHDGAVVDVYEELSHAATRLLMALEIELVGEDE